MTQSVGRMRKQDCLRNVSRQTPERDFKIKR